ncbi:MAG: hypothetical protein ACXVLQ_11595 [Bacteriovorax sp.]
MKLFSFLSICAVFIFCGCSKDKNMEDFRRDQLGQSLARITSSSGKYSGPAISKIDGTNLGEMTLQFQGSTEIQSGQVSSEQNATVSGTLSFKGLTSSEIVFDNGFYDDVTGNFQVTVPIAQDGGAVAKLSLVGVVSGDKWIGVIEVKGHPEFGAELKLLKNAPPSNTSAIEVGGTRLQQIKKMNYAYVGSYVVDGTTTPFRMSFINRDILPEQNFYRLFSPVRTVSVNCDFTDFELNFPSATLDDKTGTLVGRDPFDQRGNPAHANLNCAKFLEAGGDFGWDCEIQTKVTVLKLHLPVKK